MVTLTFSNSYIICTSYCVVSTQLQFINPKMKPEWWGWYVVVIPITWMFLKGTYYGVTAFDGDLWPNRFIGFILGIISYAWLTAYFFKQPVTVKY